MTAFWAAAALLAQAPTVRLVGPDAPYATVSAALAAARPGDTVRVLPGTYRERVVVRVPVVLEGVPGAVLDGGGAGTVLALEAPATVRGLTIRGSGRELHREDAGIFATAPEGVVVEETRLEDVLFGIYVKQSRDPVIRGNVVVGKDLPLAERGDGIRLWYVRGGLVERNRLTRVRDLVVWFSNDLVVRGNLVEDARYGLHYMYSDRNRFERNAFVGNLVGAFVMYSTDIALRHNVFAEARGASGIGLGLKDASRIRATENVIVRNAVGIHLDNAPRDAAAWNEFRGNWVAYNDVGVAPLPSVRSNLFDGNVFLDNVHPVQVPGGGSALGNRWVGNVWSEYAGFDEDGDGVGDTPFVIARWSDDLLARHPALRWFEGSPALTAVNVLARFFPLLRPEPIVVDSAPRLRAGAPPAAGPAGAAAALAGEGRPARGAAAFALVLSLAAAAVAVRSRGLAGRAAAGRALRGGRR